MLVDRRIRGGSTWYGGRPIAVRQLDGTGLPEVLFLEISGGNGCCWTGWIYAGAKRIRAPWISPPAIRDVDGDGKPEFHGYQSELAAGNVAAARNGMAAYVADGYTLGLGDEAMAVLQAAVDAGELDDPESSESGQEYLETVRRLLRERGYSS